MNQSSTVIPINYIERKPNSDQYRIVNKGVTVEFLSTLIDNADWPIERICANYGLTPAEVHAAWAFYYDNQDEIDTRVNTEEPPFTADEIKRRTEVSDRYQQATGKSYPDTSDVNP